MQVIIQLGEQDLAERMEAVRKFARSTEETPVYPPPPPLPAYLGSALEYWFEAESKQPVPL